MSDKAKVNVVLIPSEGTWVAYVPALGIATDAASPDEAFSMAKEAVELMLEAGDQEALDLLEVAYSPDAILGSIEVDVPIGNKVRLSR